MNRTPTVESTARRARPQDVVVHTLTPHSDHRGVFLEIFREVWNPGYQAVQWNAVASAGAVLRGVHVHVRHVDYLVPAAGRMLLGLHDLRPWSPTFGSSELVELDTRAPSAAIVPMGVAHGVYSLEPSVLVYGTSRYWDPSDELACRWDSPELGLSWPTTSPILSERDAAAADYPSCLQSFVQAWSSTYGSVPSPSLPQPVAAAL